MSRIRESLPTSREVGEDLLSGFRPDEGLRRFIGDREVLANGGLESADTARERDDGIRDSEDQWLVLGHDLGVEACALADLDKLGDGVQGDA